MSSALLSSALATISPESIEAEWRRRQQRNLLAEQDQSIEASRGRSKSLAGFIREAWHIVEPFTLLVWGFHIDAICQHLEAVTYGKLNRLIINVPPGTMKSLIVSVFWPAWEWGPAGLPGMRYFTTSYIIELATRDSRKHRDLVSSEWFQDRWGESCKLERTGEDSFSNQTGGWREAMAFTSLTGGRGDRVIIDDPHSVKTAESVAQLEETIKTFRESVPSRVMDPRSSAIVIVMQRLAVGDVTGVALALNLGYEQLMLPMEFEVDRCCETSIGFRDPRLYEGQLLLPEFFTRETVDRDKRALGSYAWAGQYQQRPTLREGGLFKREYFNVVKAAPIGTRWVRYWDLAATKEQTSANAAYTAGLKLGLQPNGRLVIGNVKRIRAEGHGVRKLIKDTAKEDGVLVEIGLPQDPGQAGKTQSKDMVLMLKGYIAKAKLESGDKFTRAEPIAAQAEAGNVDMIEADWNEAFLNEATEFPGGKFKDQVDALSGAFSRLIGATVFDTPEDQFTVDSLTVQGGWPRAAAIDIGRGNVAIVHAAWDRLSDTVYIYDTVVTVRQDMAIHGKALRTRGRWVPVMFDHEGGDRSTDEGMRLARQLADLDVEVYTVPLDMSAAVEEISNRLSTGRLRVFSHLQHWFASYRRLTRDDKGEITGDDTGVIAATALILTRGLSLAVTEALAQSDARGRDDENGPDDVGIGGY